jgi:O-antigen/teichoic acid export membrane protein
MARVEDERMHASHRLHSEAAYPAAAPTVVSTPPVTKVPLRFGIARRAAASVRRRGVRQNALANLLGRGWSAVFAFAFIPVYVRLLGVEAYGLIGFFATLQAVFAILDMGMSTTLSRELARLSTTEGSAPEQRDLLRTLEIPYWSAAAAIGSLVLLLSPLIAHRWLSAEQLPPDAIQHTLIMMGLVVALQFPFTLYEGGFVGLQRQVPLNAIVIIGATLRFAGVVPVLLVRPTVTAFFTWQLIVSALQTGLALVLLRRILPPTALRHRFRGELLRRIWRFAAGMTGISLTVAVLVQMDKIILSKMLPLGQFGYYTLAGALAGGLYMIISPIFSAVFPRFSQFVAAGDDRALRGLYHQACQAMSVALLPVALVLTIFPQEVVLAWTRNAGLATNTEWLVRLLVIGTALNGLMTIPYALQLASGWTRLALFGNILAIIVLAPSVVVLTRLYGAVGAATVWVALNAGYVLISLQIMHRRLLPGHLPSWCLNDVLRPLAPALSVVLIARLFVPESVLSGRFGLLALGGIGVFALVAAAAATPAARRVFQAAAD